ncbi:hypothetical protein ES703_41277 [subsurface metagenome]
METERAIELCKEAEKSLRQGKFPDHADAVKEGREALELRLKAEKRYLL